MDKSEINILVIDDDEGTNRNIEKTLLREGYTVDKAYDCLSGMEKIKQSSFHIVISDLNMPDLNGKLSERAGIDLLHWIRGDHPEIFVLMLTGSATVQSAIDALRLGAKDYLVKPLSPTELKQKILEVVKAGINFDLKIHYGQGTEPNKKEDEEVIRRLFVDSSEVNVSLIAPGTRGTVVYKVTSRDLEGRWRVPLAIKIAWKDQILIERDNFNKWVKHRIGGTRYANIIDEPVFTSRRGGVKMLFLNTELDGLIDFRTFFRAHSTEDVLKTIDNLFDQTLSYWYQTKVFDVLFLVQEYVNYLKVDKWNLHQDMNRYLKEFADTEEIYFKEIDTRFSNPVILFERLLKSEQGSEKRTYVSTLHGDLHATNIMVDNQKNAWLIDFSNTGLAHILRDFVELEAAIKFNVLETESMRDLCELETCLASQETFRDTLEFSHSDAEIQKAFEIIKLIRKKASEAISPNNDFSEYYIGLLFHSLTMIRFFPEAVSQTKKKFILFSVSKIFEQLMRYGTKL